MTSQILRPSRMPLCAPDPTLTSCNLVPGLQPSRVTLPIPDSLDAADDNLGEGVDEGPERSAGADAAEHAAPQVQAVHELPVVHGLVRLLGRCHLPVSPGVPGGPSPPRPRRTGSQLAAALCPPLPRPVSPSKDPAPRVLGCLLLGQGDQALAGSGPQARPHTFLRVVMALRRWTASWRM